MGETANIHQLPGLCAKSKAQLLLIKGENKTLLYEAAVLALTGTPQIRLLALLQSEHLPHFTGLLAIPIHGCYLTAEIKESFVHVLRAVAGGTMSFSRAVFGHSAPALPVADVGEIGAKLTKQERRILLLMADGLDNETIAQEVRLAEQTVRNYVNRIYAKLDIHNRAELVARFRPVPL